MLTVEKNITLSGQSIINGVLVETYNASMNENNPEDKFEELAYSIQDKMISEKESTQDK